MRRSVLRSLASYLGAFAAALIGATLAHDVSLAAEPVRALQAEPIENLFQLTPQIYSSGQPAGERDFATLAKLGIKTIISVDGAPPDVAAAKKHGLRYIHLPMGYDSVPPEQALKLAKAIEVSPRPVLVHCHHGKHRGPAAAAVVCMATQHWTNAEALAWLKQAGTSPNYRQMITDVERYRPPTNAQLAAASDEFSESVPPPKLVEAMVAIDEHFEQLTAASKRKFANPAQPGKVDPAHAALLLSERFRELSRANDLKSAELPPLFTAAAREAEELDRALRALASDTSDEELLARAHAAHGAVSKSCTACHARFRDNAKSAVTAK